MLAIKRPAVPRPSLGEPSRRFRELSYHSSGGMFCFPASRAAGRDFRHRVRVGRIRRARSPGSALAVIAKAGPGELDFRAQRRGVRQPTDVVMSCFLASA